MADFLGDGACGDTLKRSPIVFTVFGIAPQEFPSEFLRDRVPSRHRPRSASASPSFLARVTSPSKGPAKADSGIILEEGWSR